MLRTGRAFVLLVALVWLSGCTAMMIGGNGGGYQPPKDQCKEGETGCKSR